MLRDSGYVLRIQSAGLARGFVMGRKKKEKSRKLLNLLLKQLADDGAIYLDG